ITPIDLKLYKGLAGHAHERDLLVDEESGHCQPQLASHGLAAQQVSVILENSGAECLEETSPETFRIPTDTESQQVLRELQTLLWPRLRVNGLCDARRFLTELGPRPFTPLHSLIV